MPAGTSRWAKKFRKIVRVAGGFGLVLVGFILALPFVPGPGLALMVLGFVILSEYFPFARRLVEWGKRKLEGVPGFKGRTKREGSEPGATGGAGEPPGAADT